jgi:hypothetical protein
MPPTPGLAGVLAELAIMTSAAGACAQQTEQLSLPNVTVTAPAIPIAPPYLLAAERIGGFYSAQTNSVSAVSPTQRWV